VRKSQWKELPQQQRARLHLPQPQRQPQPPTPTVHLEQQAHPHRPEAHGHTRRARWWCTTCPTTTSCIHPTAATAKVWTHPTLWTTTRTLRGCSYPPPSPSLMYSSVLPSSALARSSTFSLLRLLSTVVLSSVFCVLYSFLVWHSVGIRLSIGCLVVADCLLCFSPLSTYVELLIAPHAHITHPHILIHTHSTPLHSTHTHTHTPSVPQCHSHIHYPPERIALIETDIPGSFLYAWLELDGGDIEAVTAFLQLAPWVIEPLTQFQAELEMQLASDDIEVTTACCSCSCSRARTYTHALTCTTMH
jgi:hypothetical protein